MCVDDIVVCGVWMYGCVVCIALWMLLHTTTHMMMSQHVSQHTTHNTQHTPIDFDGFGFVWCHIACDGWSTAAISMW